MVGGDIISAHQNCEGWGLGQTRYTEFLTVAATRLSRAGDLLERRTTLDGSSALTESREGDYLNLSMDVTLLPAIRRHGTHPNADPCYYYHPWKTNVT